MGNKLLKLLVKSFFISFSTCVLLIALTSISGTFIDFVYYLLLNTCLTIGIFICLIMINAEKLFLKTNKYKKVSNNTKTRKVIQNKDNKQLENTKVVKKKIS